MALQKFAQFDGRSRRREYWMFALVYTALIVVLTMGAGAVGSQAATGAALVFTVAMTVPQLSLGVRRLHDTGRSGLWMLVGLVPLGGLVLLYFLVQDSEPGDNEFGPNPKGDDGWVRARAGAVR
jgi:uncharacterized membrane protein YhaH (DUF805 family)